MKNTTLELAVKLLQEYEHVSDVDIQEIADQFDLDFSDLSDAYNEKKV